MAKFSDDELSFLFGFLLALLNTFQRDISLLDKSSISYDYDLDCIKDKYNMVVRILHKLECLPVYVD